MRSFWMLISSLAVVVAIGGAVYYFFPKQPAELAVMPGDVPQWPLTHGRALVLPIGNPLLTADKEQLQQWYPSYCGGDMYNQFPPKAHLVNICVDGIISRVAMATGVKLTRAEVLDPRVEVHFREVMGAK